MKKIILIILGALVVVLGGAVTLGVVTGTENLGEIYDYPSKKLSLSKSAETKAKPENAELMSYETEADSAADCSSFENYDEEAKVCYFECASDIECEDIQKKIDDELGSWAQEDSQDKGPVSEKESSEDNMLAKYSVTSGEKITYVSGEDKDEYRKIWQDVAELAPDALSNKYISAFEIFNDPKNDTLAFVDKQGEGETWRVAVNVGTYNDQTLREKKMTLVHELGHIISLNASQVSQKNVCPNLSLDEGCANVNSFVNTFWNKYWKNLGTKTPEFDENKYVTEYATTNEVEDLAETFAHFVVGSESDLGNSIKDEKIKMLYSFPELVSIRADMRNVLSRDIVRSRKLAN